MCTCNGEAFLEEQLDSIYNQSFQSWILHVSDDGSTDRTRNILEQYQSKWGTNRIKVYRGPCKGFAQNFISLLKHPDVEADYFAFSDQDDVWYPEKLERSITILTAATNGGPSLYCSRTRLINATGLPIGHSPLFTRPTSFQNALVQSIAGANTMLVSHHAKQILSNLPAQFAVVAHDWLIYLLVTASGGTAIYDSKPSLDYRQHDGNIIGANSSIKAKVIRVRKMLSGRFSAWNNANLLILYFLQITATDKNKFTLAEFAKARDSSLLDRLKHYRKSGVYRQTAAGNISLWVAIALKKL